MRVELCVFELSVCVCVFGLCVSKLCVNKMCVNELCLSKRAPPEPAQCNKCHACHACHACHTCHAKCQSMSPSATPATQSEGPCHKVPRLPRKVCGDQPQPSASPEPTQCQKCHACHAKCKSMSPSARPATQKENPISQSATPATQSVRQPAATKRVTRTNPVP